MSPRFAAVIFDLDGTLVDSAPAIRKIAARFLDELGAAPLDLAETRSFIGQGVVRLAERTLAARGLLEDDDSIARHLARFREIYAEAPGEDNVPYPGVEALLSELRAAGLPLGICTNKPGAPTRKVVDALEWSDVFSVVVTGDSQPSRKPDPAPLLYAVEVLGVAPRNALFVGDSEVDAATTAAAGTAFALHLNGYRQAAAETLGADFLFEDYAELARYALPSPTGL